MHRDQDESAQFLWYDGSGLAAFSGQKMMGLIQDDPMRASRLGAKFQQFGEETGKEERPIREGKSQQIHNQG